MKQSDFIRLRLRIAKHKMIVDNGCEFVGADSLIYMFLTLLE